MSSEPKPAAKLGMEFVHEFQNLIQKSDRTCRIREISVCLVTSKAELRRSGTPPVCDSHDFAHLAIPVHIQVAGMDVVSSRVVYAALVFNSDTNTVAVEYVFGENDSSTVTLSWQSEDGRDLQAEITTVGLSHYIDVDVGAANTDCTAASCLGPKSGKVPSDMARSNGPMNSMSIPGTAAISAAFATAVAVSIITATTNSSLALAI